MHKSLIEELLSASNRDFAKARKIYPQEYNPDHTVKRPTSWVAFRDILTIIFVFFITIAVLDTWNHTFSQIFLYLASNYSATTTGTITKSKLVRSDGYRSIVLKPQVEYKYNVSGQTFTSRDVVVFDRYSLNKEKFLLKYLFGKTVTIHYDKKWPSFSALELTPPRFEDWETFIMGLLFALGITSGITYIYPTRVIRLNMYVIWAILIFATIVAIILDQIYT